MKLFNNLNRKLPKKEKELMVNISNNLLSLIEKSTKNNDKEISVLTEKYNKELEEYKQKLEDLKNENRQLIGDLKILRDNEIIIKQQNDELDKNNNELNKNNKDISDKLKECEKKIKQYIIQVNALEKLSNDLNNELNENNNMMISMLFKAYNIICNDLIVLINNIKQPIINIKSEINNCIAINASYGPPFVDTIIIDDNQLRIDYKEYIDILDKPTFDTDFEPFIDEKIKVILDDIEKLNSPPYNIELLEIDLIRESSRLRDIYNIINHINIFYTNELSNKVINLADQVLEKKI